MHGVPGHLRCYAYLKIKLAVVLFYVMVLSSMWILEGSNVDAIPEPADVCLLLSLSCIGCSQEHQISLQLCIYVLITMAYIIFGVV